MTVSEAIESRRSLRSFSPIDITDEVIHELAKAAQLAPSCNNKQPWQFIFVYDREPFQTLYTTINKGNFWVKDASMVVVNFAFREDDSVIGNREYYLYDTGIASGFMMLRAAELGLVTHPIAGYDEALVKELLSIPEEACVISLLVVGGFSEVPNNELSFEQQVGEQRRPPRKPMDEFIFHNEYRHKQ